MKISDIEVSNIRFGKLEDNLRTPSQKIAFISYERDRTPLNAITPEFITGTYGIPREGPYYQTDRSRAFFKMPFCREFKKHDGEINYAEIEACYKKLQDIDDYLVSKEFRVQLFGEKHADRYEYQPIVHAVQDLEDTENYFRPPYAKYKLDLAYNDDAPAFKVYDMKMIAIECSNKTAPQSNPCIYYSTAMNTTTIYIWLIKIYIQTDKVPVGITHTYLPIPFASRGRRDSQ